MLFNNEDGGGSLIFKKSVKYFEKDGDDVEMLGMWQSYCVIYNAWTSDLVSVKFIISA